MLIVNALTEKIFSVINNDLIRFKLAKSGYHNIINHFSWESSVNQFKKLIKLKSQKSLQTCFIG